MTSAFDQRELSSVLARLDGDVPPLGLKTAFLITAMIKENCRDQHQFEDGDCREVWHF